MKDTLCFCKNSLMQMSLASAIFSEGIWTFSTDLYLIAVKYMPILESVSTIHSLKKKILESSLFPGYSSKKKTKQKLIKT